MNHINRKVKKGIAGLISIVTLTCFSSFSTAVIIGAVNGSPQGSGTIKDNQVSTARTSWNGTSDSGNFGFGQSYQIRSNSGRFIVGGTAIATNNRRISTTLVAGTVNQFIIQETLQIPRSALAAARQNNINIIEYERTFTDDSGGPDVTGTTNFRIINSNNGTLSLSQVDLRFANKNLTKVIKVNESLSAYAEISHGGTGLFQAVWEVANPISTSGTPIFTRLETIRKFLGAGRNIIIESPPLPSNLTGNYILRLRITSPSDTFEDLQLRYSVISSNTPTITLQTILPIAPLPNSLVDDETLFSWQAIEGAHTYQIEIYETHYTDLPTIGSDSLTENNQDKHSQTFSSGVLLPSEKTSSTLTKIALQHLEKDRSYQWRIVAINQDGFIIGKSTYRNIQLKSLP